MGGGQKFGMSLETQGIKLFWRDIPGFCRDIPEAPEKFEKKMFGFNSRPLGKFRKSALPLKYAQKIDVANVLRGGGGPNSVVVLCLEESAEQRV